MVLANRRALLAGSVGFTKIRPVWRCHQTDIRQFYIFIMRFIKKIVGLIRPYMRWVFQRIITADYSAMAVKIWCVTQKTIHFIRHFSIQETRQKITRMHIACFSSVFAVTFGALVWIGDEEVITPPLPENGFQVSVEAPVRHLLPVYHPKLMITSHFGERSAARGKRMHKGVDIAPVGGGKMPHILSSETGTVVYAGWRSGYGNTVEIYHRNGTWTRYGHLKSYNVKPGDAVARGKVIGEMGNTGTVRGKTGYHLHYEQIVSSGAQITPIFGGFDALPRGKMVDYDTSYYAIYSPDGRPPVRVSVTAAALAAAAR